MKRDYVLDTRSRISRSAWRYIISSDQYFYSDRERTVEVKGTREQEEKEKKKRIRGKRMRMKGEEAEQPQSGFSGFHRWSSSTW